MNKEERIRFATEQLLGQGHLDAVDRFFSADYSAHAGDKDYHGHDFVKRFATQLRSVMPDLQVLEIKILAQEGRTITWQRTLRGSHKADLMGIPPSGKKVTWIEMVVTRFEGEEIVEEWVVSELAGKLLLHLPAKK
jgi:predicted ester cyclase